MMNCTIYKLPYILSHFADKLYEAKHSIAHKTINFYMSEVEDLIRTWEAIQIYYDDFKLYCRGNGIYSVYREAWKSKSIYQYWDDAIKNSKLKEIPLDTIMDKDFFEEMIEELRCMCKDGIYYGVKTPWGYQ